MFLLKWQIQTFVTINHSMSLNFFCIPEIIWGCVYIFIVAKSSYFHYFLQPALCDINSFVYYPGVCGFSIISLWSWGHCRSGFPFIYLFLSFASVDVYGMCLHVDVQVPVHTCGFTGVPVWVEASLYLKCIEPRAHWFHLL